MPPTFLFVLWLMFELPSFVAGIVCKQTHWHRAAVGRHLDAAYLIYPTVTPVLLSQFGYGFLGVMPIARIACPVKSMCGI